MLKKNVRYAILITIAVIAVLLVILSKCSADIAVWSTGEKGIVSTYYGRDLDGKEYQVVVCGSQDEVGKILYLSKGFAGFWKVGITSQKADADTGMTMLYWQEAYGSRFHISSPPMEMVFAWHLMVSGNNATAEITILKDYLPEGVTVGIQQWGSRYVLHLISLNGDREELAKIDVYDMIEHCVE